MKSVKNLSRKILKAFKGYRSKEGDLKKEQGNPVKSQLGFVDHIGLRHVHGWVMDPDDPVERLSVEAFLPETGEKLGAAVASQFNHGIAGVGDNSRQYGFWFPLAREITPEEQKTLQIRVPGRNEICRAPNLESWHPLLHVAMDIVDNCNLRCPFCLYDYSNVRKTHFMTQETLESALRLMPYIKDREFWFSCLHEPSLHPDFLTFLDLVPGAMRKKVFFTSNFARRMPDTYFEGLAKSEISHVNISLESLTPEIYERMRKGARFPIFKENWGKLIAAFNEVNSSVNLYYIIMAYKSNLHELPSMARYLIEERRAARVEIRYTYDVPFIDTAFREQEFLQEEDWDWLQANLPYLDAGQVVLDRPPFSKTSQDNGAEPDGVPVAYSEAGFLPDRYLARLMWDGTLELRGISRASQGEAMVEIPILTRNIRDIDDLDSFFHSLNCSKIPS